MADATQSFVYIDHSDVYATETNKKFYRPFLCSSLIREGSYIFNKDSKSNSSVHLVHDVYDDAWIRGYRIQEIWGCLPSGVNICYAIMCFWSITTRHAQ